MDFILNFVFISFDQKFFNLDEAFAFYKKITARYILILFCDDQAN